jgi:hypothetical protein
MSAQDARVRAFCPCCAGTGRTPDEYGDGWIEANCVSCYGSGLNYPTDQLYRPWETLALRWGWIVVVVGTGLLCWLVLA